MAEERWRWVVGYEGLYMVSDQGRVMSVPRKTGRSSWPGKLLKQGRGGSGYPHVAVSVKGNQKTVEVHRLVAEAFIPNPDGKREVNHIDGDKSNNRVENLEWATRSENVRHAYENLPRKQFDHFHRRKLTEQDVAAICKTEGTNKEIAKAFGVSDVMVGRIKRREAWRHVTCR